MLGYKRANKRTFLHEVGGCMGWKGRGRGSFLYYVMFPHMWGPDTFSIISISL